VNPVLHHFRKDIRRLWPLLGVWLACLASLVWLQSLQFGYAHRVTEWSALVDAAVPALAVTYSVVLVLLCASVILEDPAIGTSTFWMTRPLDPGQIALEKLLLLGCILVVPGVVDMISVGCFGASLPMAMVAGLSYVLGLGLTGLATAAFAVTAESLGRFALNAILTLIGTGILSFLRAALMMFPRFEASQADGMNRTFYLTESRFLVTSLLIAVLAAGVVYWRYLFRHARFTMMVVVGCTLLVVEAATSWPWILFRFPTLSAEQVRAYGPVDFRGAAAPAREASTPRNGYQPNVHANLLETCFPDGATAVPLPLDSKLLLVRPGSPRPEPVNTAFSEPFQTEARYPRALAHAVAPARFLNPRSPAPIALAMSARPEKGAAGGKGRISGTLWAEIRQYQVEAEVPAREGAALNWGMKRLEVISAGRGPGGTPQMTIQTGSVTGELGAWVEQSPETPYNPMASTTYVLLNRGTGEAILLTAAADPTASAGSYQRVREVLTAPLCPELPEGWLSGASLVRLRFAELGRVRATVEADVTVSGQAW
jgi:hypothetical protein